MTPRFDCFVVLAEMRTGSNLLETNLNALPDVTCHGEAFNPGFAGYPGKAELLGFDLPRREADPDGLLSAIRSQPGLNGFRFFHDHDPRVLETVIGDSRCAKIILTRNRADSYVSWKIAQQTGQWKLTNVKKRRSARIRFDSAEFRAFLERRTTFQARIRADLQYSGQTAFHLDYEELVDVGILNGLAGFLGAKPVLTSVLHRTRKQNPAPLSEKVINFREMERTLGAFGMFDADRTPVAEPEKGPGVPNHVACPRTALLFMPTAGPATPAVRAWMAALDNVAPTGLPTGFSQKSLRQWKRRRPGHRSLTVICHPAERAHWAYCQLLRDMPENAKLRAWLHRNYDPALPEHPPGPGHDRAAHRLGFLTFLDFLRACLRGQTGLTPRPEWTSQSQLVQDMSRFCSPDVIVRGERLREGLNRLCAELGVTPGADPPVTAGTSLALADVHDATTEAAVKAAYQRDYMMFGYGPWRGHAA